MLRGSAQEILITAAHFLYQRWFPHVSVLLFHAQILSKYSHSSRWGLNRLNKKRRVRPQRNWRNSLLKNLVKSRTFLEMLENSIKKYYNKILTAAEVIEELIKLSKGVVETDNEAQLMGLTDFEYAFYTAVASNDSARELMQQETLRELAVVLTEIIRQNASIDWTIKESAKVKLKVGVKRLLRKYGYPPDIQMLATETVLKQAEMIASEISK